MLNKKLQIKAIANRMAGIKESLPVEVFTEPWHTCWKALEKAEPGKESEALMNAVQECSEREYILNQIFAVKPSPLRDAHPSLLEMSSSLPPVTWLWQDWLPRGMLSILGAAPGVGKSFLGMDLAWRIIGGHPFPDGRPVQVRSEDPRVIYVDAEAIPQVINERAQTYNLDRNRLYLMLPDGCESIDFGEPKYRQQLESMVASLRPELVIIDSLSSIHSRGQNNVEDVRDLLHFLSTLANDWDIGMLLIHHVRKPGNGMNMQAYNLSMSDLSGSGYIVAMARVVWGLHVVQTEPNPDPNGPRRLKMLKTNFGAYAAPLGFTFTPKKNGAVLQWLDTPPEDYHAPTKLKECQTWLLNFLADSPKKPKEVVAAGNDAGFSRRMIYRARENLESQIENTTGKNSPQNRWRLRGK